MSDPRCSCASDNGYIELKSEDGEIFKVQGYHLKSASIVLRDMLAMPGRPASPVDAPSSSGSIPSDDPIEIQAHSGIVRLFVGLMVHGPLDSATSIHECFPADHPFHEASAHVAVLSAVLDLLDQFDCAATLRDRAFLHFEPVFRGDPWVVYCLAARYEDISTARKAIRSVGGSDSSYWDAQRKLDSRYLSTAEAARAPLNWLLGYMRAHAAVMAADIDAGGHEFRDRVALWLDIPPP